MADAQSLSKKTGLTRGKMLVIGILAVVLVLVLWAQFGSSSAPTGKVAYRPQQRPNIRPASSIKPTLATGAAAAAGIETQSAPIIDEARWKPPEVSTVICYDPFALPAAFPQPQRAVPGKSPSERAAAAAVSADETRSRAESLARMRAQLDELQQRGVNVIVREQDHYAAWIGERKVHVGDRIGGFTITAIDPMDGLQIERKESP